MDQEHIRGTTEKTRGAVKETAGKLMADEGLRAKGKGRT
jgi:uncharacterized protein YjbJ (UPF0337 family)